jgi:hypothetical protein
MGRYLFIFLLTFNGLIAYPRILPDTLVDHSDPAFRFNIGFEFESMSSKLTDLENVRARNDFLNFGLTTTIKFKQNLSIETKISLVKYGVLREEPSQDLFLETFYLNKQVIRSIQVPVMVNFDRFRYSPSNGFYNYYYVQAGFYYSYLLDATLKYEGELYWEDFQPLPSFRRTKIRNTEYYRSDIGAAAGLGFSFKAAKGGPGIGLGALFGMSLRPITSPDYTSDQHGIIFMQMYMRFLLFNRVI